MLRKQAKRILLVMLFVLTFVLAGRVDTNAQARGTGRCETGKSGQQFCNSTVGCCYAE